MDQVTISRELLRQVLDAMNETNFDEPWYESKRALMAALEQPAVEPVAYGRWHEDGGYIDMVFLDKEECSQYLDDDEEPVALFAAPPPPADVPLLTDDERYDMYRQVMQEHYIDSLHYWRLGPARKYAVDIERAVRQKAGLK